MLLRWLVFHYDERVHSLVLDFHPLAASAHVCFVIRSGVKIFRSATIALHGEQVGIAGFHHRATQAEQLREDLLHRLGIIGVDFQPQIGAVAIGAPDAELLHLEAAAELDHGVEDLLHDMGVDQVALSLDALLEWEGLAVGGHGSGFQLADFQLIGYLLLER